MSMWTHVTGCIYLDTMVTKRNIKKYVENILKNAPLITGSEQNADVFINPLNGYNTSIYNSQSIKNFQTCVGITIVADLRDREIEETREEIENFLDFIRDNFLIINIGLNLTDGNKNILFVEKENNSYDSKEEKLEKEVEYE